MNLSFGIGFALPLALGIAALGGAIGLGKAVEGAMNAIGRQPEASGRLFLPFVIGCALIEALTIYALVAFFAGQGALTATIEAARAAAGGG
jgi:F-type H+-transporting ATPase subunit c